jgi:enoyl-CoA hydratase
MEIPGIAELGKRPIAELIELGQRVMRSIELLPIPVIAMVDGLAVGAGLELALAADLVIATDRAKFGSDELGIGLIPGFGGIQRLAARCGPGMAKRMIFTGEVVASAEALLAGLIDKVVPSEELRSYGMSMAESIGQKAPLAVKAAKDVLRRSSEQERVAGMRHEVEEFLALFETADREEGMEAVMQKRAPCFTGK